MNMKQIVDINPWHVPKDENSNKEEMEMDLLERRIPREKQPKYFLKRKWDWSKEESRLYINLRETSKRSMYQYETARCDKQIGPFCAKHKNILDNQKPLLDI